MKTEHFIYGLFNHYGIKLIKSPGINALLTGEIIDYLCHIEKNGTHQNLWPNGIVTVSNIHQVVDEYGRKGIWNHTIAFRILDLLQHVQPSTILQPYFIDSMNVPTKLEPLKVE